MHDGGQSLILTLHRMKVDQVEVLRARDYIRIYQKRNLMNDFI